MNDSYGKMAMTGRREGPSRREMALLQPRVMTDRLGSVSTELTRHVYFSLGLSAVASGPLTLQQRREGERER